MLRARTILPALLIAAAALRADARIGYGGVGVDDATTLWPGVFEFKMGVDAGARYKLEGSRLDVIRAPMSLRYGWQERLEFGLGVPFVFQNSADRKFDGSGVSDVSVALKYQMTRDDGNVPASATEVKLGYGSGKTVSSEALSLGVFYSVSKSFEEGQSVGHLNLGYTLFASHRDDVLMWGAAYERRLYETMRWSVGVNSGNQMVPGVKNDIVAELGIAKEINPTLECTLSGGAGINKQGPEWQMRLGLTKEFGEQAGKANAYRHGEWSTPPAPGAAEIIQKGELAERLGDHALAVSYYREAIAKDSTVPSAWNNMGIALYKLGRTREALEAYENAAKLAPTDADIYYNMGLADYKLGDFLAARKAFAKALENKPDHEAARSSLLALEGRTGTR